MNVDKVVWKDGLFVQPQHFQQTERFLLHQIHSTHQSATPYYFGFSELAFDDDLLRKGTLALTAASGIMPDGTPFAMPVNNIIPPLRSIEDHFPAEADAIDVYLGLPLIQEGKPSIPVETIQMAVRFSPEISSTTDEVLGRTAEEIELARLNFVLRFGDEPQDSLTTLKVARVVRESENQFALDKAYFPPLLRIGAWPPYLKQIESAIINMKLKASELLKSRRQIKPGLSEFPPTETTPLMMSILLTTNHAVLSQYAQSQSAHPHEVHQTLIQIAGALQTFLPDNTPQELPAYEHRDIHKPTQFLLDYIKNILFANYTTGCISIPLNQTGPATFECGIEDTSMIDNAEFFLGVSAPVEPEELTQSAKHVIKISSRENLPRLTISALPGLPLSPVHNPPNQLATKQGFIYLKLQKTGDHWKNVSSSKTFAFYYPHNFPELKMEFLAISGS